MLSFFDHATPQPGLPTRREVLRVGGLSALGLGLPALARARPQGRAKACILLWLFGGPPQHSTWDPKPEAPAEVRGEFKPIATRVPGIQISELLPNAAARMDRIALLRAISTGDNAHSSSGYQVLTGVPHQPLNQENVNPGAPNDWPTLGGIVFKLLPSQGPLPSSIRLPHRIFNTDGSVWPGQDAGFLGRAADPWLFHCRPADREFRVPELVLATDVPGGRFDDRAGLLARLDRGLAGLDRGPIGMYDQHATRALDLLRSAPARAALDLEREPTVTRDRYGRGQFGQSVLLARRLIEAGVSLVQVNWFRGADEPSDAPCWDSHARESQRLKNDLAPVFDQAFGALLDDLTARGMLDEVLVVCLAEFGRTPRFNGRAGRDHWGAVFSSALAGGGVRGGTVHGASDRNGGYPVEGMVTPADLTATVLDALGVPPDAELHDGQGRPFPASRGRVVRAVF